jgi:hypothetical protein
MAQAELSESDRAEARHERNAIRNAHDEINALNEGAKEVRSGEMPE